MPYKSKRPCAYPGCPEICSERFCDKHSGYDNKTYNKEKRNKETQAIYNSGAWKKIRKLYYESHPLCEDCLENGKTVPAVEVHHIKPLSAGGTNDTNNLRSLCRSCHSLRHKEIGDRPLWGRGD